MVDFLHEYAMDSEDEWSVDIEEEIVSGIYYEILCEYWQIISIGAKFSFSPYEK